MIETQRTTQQEGAVHKTMNYHMFKGLIGNRGVSNSHVRKLRSSIAKRNLLEHYPILVNKDMFIIDGQHRLMAAQELNVPVYYQIVEKAGLEEVQLLNANNRAWITQDYLDSYVAMGKGDYITLQEFANEYRLSVAISMMILADQYDFNGKLRYEFKNGDFVIKDYQKAEKMASLINEIRRHSPDDAWVDRDCIRALNIVLEKIDPKLLTNQLDRYQLVITRRVNVKDYLREFENIVNQNREAKPIFLVTI